MAHVYKNKGIHGRPENAGSDEKKAKMLATGQKDTEGILGKILPCYREGSNTKRKLEQQYKGQWTEEFLNEVVNEYFEYCFSVDLKPTPSSLSLWLGVTKRTIQLWKSDSSNGYKFRIINKAYGIMENYLESNIDKYPTGSIFLLKTSHKFIEQSKIDVTSNGNSISDKNEVKELISKLGLDEK